MAHPAVLNAKEDDIQKMLAAQVHIGTQNSDFMMAEYIWRRNQTTGVHIINIGKTWEKLMLAARSIVAIENPEDVIAISARPFSRASASFALSATRQRARSSRNLRCSRPTRLQRSSTRAGST